MGIDLVFHIVIVALLVIIAVLLIVGKKKSEISERSALLKKFSDEQRDSIANQFLHGVTEQFIRFDVIKESVQNTLKNNRVETNDQLGKFSAQIDSRLSANQEQTQKTLTENIEKVNETLESKIKSLQESNEKRLEQMQGVVNQHLEKFSVQVREFGEQLESQLSSIRRDNRENIEKVNETLESKIKSLQESNEKRLEQIQGVVNAHLEKFSAQIREFGEQLDSRSSSIQRGNTENLEKVNETLESKIKSLQESNEKRLEQIQGVVNEHLEKFSAQIRELGEQLDSRFSSIQRGNTENIEKVNETLESKIKSLQESNEKRLEQMQGIVDEKLQKTLEARLAQSFELVSKQLDSVQQGLGEMKNLAADAKSLKNALTNVKERGTYGEVRLEKLLSDILAPSQYEMNVEIGNNKRVEFAIKLPGNGDTPVLLPIDSKFPIEDYNRLLDAEDKQTIDEARKSLAQKIRVFAKDINDKYIAPPKTTDFALMFLPTEGLYAEVVQNAAFFEELRVKYKVTAIGATTLSAFLASLQMGFKTLAIEKRSQEVWNTLGGVKAEFAKFVDILDRAHKQIQTAEKTLEEIRGKRMRAINRTLRTVEVLDEPSNALLLETSEVENDE